MSQRVITLWFKKHQYDINDVDGFLLLSCLFPDKHDPRDFGISKEVLARIIGRAWSVSREQFKALLEPAHPGDRSDLGERVEHITKQQDGLHPYPRTYLISIEEINEVLSILAARHSYALDPSKSDLLKAMQNVLTAKLAPLFRRCLPMERKWLTRLVMKSYAPIVMPEDLVLSLYHPWLLGMKKLFDIKAAIRFCRRIDQKPASGADDARSRVRGPAPNTGNDANVPEAMDGEPPAQPMPQEARNVSRSVPQLDILEPTSNSETDKASSHSLTFVFPRDWINQPRVGITNTAGNKAPTQIRNEKSSVVGRASQATKTPIPQAPSTKGTVSGSLRPSRSRSHCTKTGRDCLLYKKDIGLLPPLSCTTAIREMLDKHKAAPIDIEKFIEGKVGGRRQVLLVDQTADGLEDAYERLRGTHTYDARGRKQWVDIYDWHLLCFISTHGTCRETSQEGWRRYWVGTA